jgi:hypothetical protein
MAERWIPGVGLKCVSLAAFAVVSLALAGSAQAAVIHELPTGKALSFAGVFESKRLDDGRFTRDYDGFTFAAEPAPITTNEFVSSSIDRFDYGANGVYEGPLITLSGYGRGLFEFKFDLNQSAVLFDLNWRAGLSGVGPTVLSIYDSNNQLLETTTLSHSDPTGLIGFGNRNTADIAKLTITGNAFGLRNMSVSDAVPMGAVPEPGTWALMILGFGAAGAQLRRRRGVRATA